ncbi:Prefoldin subunit [Giardia muris]|uniref:Prefoldin subunit n=1 Tax=Giardia muris TaxID=5742 RepID=A0A4Z1T067_GIAMU|nr:Prefoldin subunit [Giardia muris]|eukprot:TNJ27293.1 Prefoldin subunit [Giardia muris]
MSTTTLPQTIDVSTLPLPVLQQLHRQVAVEIETLSKTIPLIQGAINRRAAAAEAISSFKSVTPTDEVLVPLTQSTYVKGHVPDSSKVLVMLGGGHFAELSIEDAIEFEESRLQARRAEFTRVRNAISTQSQIHTQLEAELARRASNMQKGTKPE